jgi:hypothetical protein
MDDPDTLEHPEISVHGALRKVAASFEELGDRERSLGIVEDFDQGTPSGRVALVVGPEALSRDRVQLGEHGSKPTPVENQ